MKDRLSESILYEKVRWEKGLYNIFIIIFLEMGEGKLNERGMYERLTCERVVGEKVERE